MLHSVQLQGVAVENYLDCSNFKKFNDSYGHQVGDKVLQAVARTLKAQAVRPGDSVFRYGGEEFAVLLSNTNLAGAKVVAEKIRRSIEQTPVILEDRPYYVIISAGISVYDSRGQTLPVGSLEDFLRQADMHLYKAKENGRNRFEAGTLTDIS